MSDNNFKKDLIINKLEQENLKDLFEIHSQNKH